MTAQILAAELSNLIQDAKRKNTELRTAAEKTLQDLKSLPNTSEAQLSAGEPVLTYRSSRIADLRETSQDDPISYHRF